MMVWASLELGALSFLFGHTTCMYSGMTLGLDSSLSDTYFVIAHFHMVMGIAPLMVIFGAIYHWFPLIWKILR